jgi:hypothetical protein
MHLILKVCNAGSLKGGVLSERHRNACSKTQGVKCSTVQPRFASASGYEIDGTIRRCESGIEHPSSEDAKKKNVEVSAMGHGPLGIEKTEDLRSRR